MFLQEGLDKGANQLREIQTWSTLPWRDLRRQRKREVQITGGKRDAVRTDAGETCRRFYPRGQAAIVAGLERNKGIINRAAFAHRRLFGIFRIIGRNRQDQKTI